MPSKDRHKKSHVQPSHHSSDWNQQTYSTTSVDDGYDWKKPKRNSRRLALLGAIAGAFLGHKVGDGKLASIAGAAIGAYGFRELGR